MFKLIMSWSIISARKSKRGTVRYSRSWLFLKNRNLKLMRIVLIMNL